MSFKQALLGMVSSAALAAGVPALAHHSFAMFDAEKNVKLGMGPQEARTRALRSFGPMEKHKEETRDARGVSWLETLVADDLWPLPKYSEILFVR